MEQFATAFVIGWKLSLAIVAGSSALTTLGVFFLARFTHVFDAYAGERARLRAQYDNLEKLVEQTGRLTETTKIIESRVSYDLWDRQMRWTYLRDTYAKLLDALARLRTCQLHLRQLQELRAASDPSSTTAGAVEMDRVRATEELKTTIAEVINVRDAALLVMSEELHSKLQTILSGLRGTQGESWQEDCRSNQILIETAIMTVRQAARGELGYDTMIATTGQ